MIGATPPSVSELTRSSERLSYIYVEHATIHRADNAITVTEERGVTHIPAASLSALLLGPGTRVTHQAMVLLGECGTSAIWVGEQGVRYYAHGRSLARSSRLLIAQAEKSVKYSFPFRGCTHHVCVAFPWGRYQPVNDAAASRA